VKSMAATDPDLTPEDYRALAHFRHLIRHFLNFSTKAARAAGLPPQQHQLLLAIKGVPRDRKPTVTTLAWLLQLRHHSAVELIDRLIKKGLARRDREEGDRRVVRVSLTPKSEKLLLTLSLLHREELRRTGPELSDALRSIVARRGG
jgi:DNA-binding MarR family transcriptional regulator